MNRTLNISALVCLVLSLAVPLGLAQSSWAGGVANFVRFGFSAKDGYRIRVEGHRTTISLSVSHSERVRNAEASTIYFARARLGDNRIRASFGPLGSVAMRFRPSGRIIHAASEADCKGAQRTVHLGTFIGTLFFRGEGGYVSTRIHRAKGRLINPGSPHCATPAFATSPKYEGGDHQRGKLTSLSAGFKLGLSAVYFTASTGRAPKAHYLAIAEQGAGQIAIYHAAYAEASPLTFATDSALSFASLTPPPPFSGTGSLQRDAEGVRTWTGSLAVSFPGDPDVLLTGSQFKTELTRSW
jgi:hypothetical protein